MNLHQEEGIVAGSIASNMLAPVRVRPLLRIDSESTVTCWVSESGEDWVKNSDCDAQMITIVCYRARSIKEKGVTFSSPRPFDRPTMAEKKLDPTNDLDHTLIIELDYCS